MEQLRMTWYSYPGLKRPEIKLPPGFSLRHFTAGADDVEAWLDIVFCGLTEKREDSAFFDACMRSYKNLREDMIFFVTENEKPVATATVICDCDKKVGYIHMVACVPSCRNKGIGTQLNNICVCALMDAGMESAYLTTDDFRIPAIKSYLRCGFLPDLSTEDFRRRWAEIFRIL